MLDPRHLQDLSLLSPKTAVLQSLKNLAVNHLHIGVVSSFTQPMMLCSFHLRLRSLFFPATHSTGALHPHISCVGRCVQSARSCRGTERTIPFSLVFLIFRSFQTYFHNISLIAILACARKKPLPARRHCRSSVVMRPCQCILSEACPLNTQQKSTSV